MNITLLSHTPLKVCACAIRTCWQSFDKSDDGGEKDRELIDRVGNKFKHSSTLEHLVYTFYIKGISRALLQELARHRLASLSVKSTRYTLKELKTEKPFTCSCKRVEKYLVMTKNTIVDEMSIKALENLRVVLNKNVSNDIAKYCLPESYKSELTWTINARSLQNFITLRSDKSALWEMQKLAHAVYNKLPSDHKYIFTIKQNE
ncbi:MAG: FAD-dependent thymidylate synthase [Sulfurospirillum sp.]|nr:FAD-dependent thymidylate synthase [Sulfurospirillum sp.]